MPSVERQRCISNRADIVQLLPAEPHTSRRYTAIQKLNTSSTHTHYLLCHFFVRSAVARLLAPKPRLDLDQERNGVAARNRVGSPYLILPIDLTLHLCLSRIAFKVERDLGRDQFRSGGIVFGMSQVSVSPAIANIVCQGREGVRSRVRKEKKRKEALKKNWLGSAAFVTMMQSADFRNGYDLSGAGWLNWPRLGRIFL